MELELMQMLLSLLAMAQKDPWGPATAGALLALVSFILFKGPLKARVDAFLDTTLKKRVAVVLMGVLPAVVALFDKAAQWDRALGTAVLSVLVSQGVFFLMKAMAKPGAEPESGDAPKDGDQ